MAAPAPPSAPAAPAAPASGAGAPLESTASASRPGHLCWVVGGTRFELPQRYRLVRAVGTGSYGVVVAAEDTSCSPPARVAIKKVQAAFADAMVEALRPELA